MGEFLYTNAIQPRLVSYETLFNMRQIDHVTSKSNIYATTYLNCCGPNTSLSHNLGTNDQMIRYKRIKLCLFIDTSFVTREVKRTNGFLCMQLFVKDKGYTKISMKSPSQFMASRESKCQIY